MPANASKRDSSARAEALRCSAWLGHLNVVTIYDLYDKAVVVSGRNKLSDKAVVVGDKLANVSCRQKREISS